MKKILLFLLLTLNLNAQNCLIVYDDIEAYSWTGAGWAVGYPTTGFYNNASVSPTLSAVLYGSGTGTSNIEQGFYILPSATPISAAYDHRLSFRLASYRFTSPTGTAAGVDVSDYIDVQVSTNGGAYITELRITGNNNAYWSYSSTAVASKTINGTLTTFTPAAGGDRTTTGDGYSYINVTIPAGPTQVAFRIYCRVNAAGEEWWMDEFELNQLAPCVVLPIKLINFEGHNKGDYYDITWSTATELNNNYFILERSSDGINWFEIKREPGSGTSNTINTYNYNDYEYKKNVINYYRLTQVDYDGKKEKFDVIYINPKVKNQIYLYEYFDLNGKPVNYEKVSSGIYIRKCGEKIEKIVKID